MFTLSGPSKIAAVSLLLVASVASADPVTERVSVQHRASNLPHKFQITFEFFNSSGTNADYEFTAGEQDAVEVPLGNSFSDYHGADSVNPPE